MSQPRQVVPGATYLITRRCAHRAFRLRPTEDATRVMRYCLALALERTGIVLHAVCVMSNHHHLVLSDPRGELPVFLRELHRTSAKAMNALQGQWENFWAAGACSVVRLADENDVIDKIAYVAANPVSAGVVPHPEDWPGLCAWTPTAVAVERPSAYFGKRSRAPASLTLRVQFPSAANDTAAGLAWGRRLRAAVAAKVNDAKLLIARLGRTFVGRANAVSVDVVRATAEERRRTTIPELAARDPSRRRALRQERRIFRLAYRRALDGWKSVRISAIVITQIGHRDRSGATRGWAERSDAGVGVLRARLLLSSGGAL